MTDKSDSLVADYERWLRSWGASPKTIKARVNLARGRLRAWTLTGVTTDNITVWLGREGLSHWTRATYHANLKDFCSWLVATDRLDANPMDDPTIKKPKRPRSRPRPLTEAEVVRVLETARGRTRDWLILALCAGLRAHEIAKLRGEHVSREGIYVSGKGGAEDTLPCHPDIWEMATRYPQRGWWFPNRQHTDHVTADVVTVAVSRLFDELGIDGSIHRLRHVYGTRLLRSGTNIRKVQRLMRHATLETTAVYTAVDEDELRDAIFMLPSSQPDTGPPDAA
ncbi:MAG TPA: site-specific integrase [Acidimicrobiales bacterium]|nr:site-specific integrase [Acidimicrobiales bacterium]